MVLQNLELSHSPKNGPACLVPTWDDNADLQGTIPFNQCKKISNPKAKTEPAKTINQSSLSNAFLFCIVSKTYGCEEKDPREEFYRIDP